MPHSILVTGACGNLGSKLIQSLAEENAADRLFALDLLPAFPEPFKNSQRVTFIQADLADSSDQRWHDAVRNVDTIIHFAARNPYPDASWEEATASFAMTKNLVDAAITSGVKRFIFASSNHVMGGYKEEWDQIKTAFLTSETPVRPGTAFRGSDGTYSTSLPYAVAKVMGECYCDEQAKKAVGELTFISIRIGWCQPGDNKPETLSASGTPKTEGDAVDKDYLRDLRWFRSMWLSNRDFTHLLTCAIQANADTWPSKSLIINGVSNNQGMPWDIQAAERFLGYQPKDNVFDRPLG